MLYENVKFISLVILFAKFRGIAEGIWYNKKKVINSACKISWAVLPYLPTPNFKLSYDVKIINSAWWIANSKWNYHETKNIFLKFLADACIFAVQ